MSQVYKMSALAILSFIVSVTGVYSQPTTEAPPEREFEAALTIGNATTDFINTKLASDALDKTKNPGATAKQDALTRENEQRKVAVESTATRFRDSAQVQTSAANFWVTAGDNVKAFAHADAAVKAAEKHMTNPRNLADALQARALAEAAAGDAGRARADAQQVLKMYPDDEGALLIAQMTDREGRSLPGSLSVNGKRVSPPDSVRGRSTGVATGRANARGGSAAGASGIHGETVGIDDQVGTVNWQRVAASIVVNRKAIDALKRQDYPAMHNFATQATTLFPQNVNSARAAAFASAMMGHNQDALAEASAALSLRPEAPQLLALRAQVYNQLERPDAALKDALHAIANNPKEPAAWAQKGLAREKLGEPPESFLPDLQKAAELDPSFQLFYREALARRGGGGSKKAAGAAGGAPALGSLARIIWEFNRLLPDEKANPWFGRGLWIFNGAILLLGVYLARRLLRGD